MDLRKTAFPGIAAAAATIMLAAVPASAASTAYNTRTSYLTASPAVGMATSCTARSIALSSGSYDWRLQIGGNVSTARSIYLAAGTYSWKTCLQPQDGYYYMYDTVDKAGSESAAINTSFVLGQSGTYTWGAQLDPKF
ncbi:hypothetical protein SSTG_05791 [Streptomyces sp. e14]|uniref:hypothetical protein n=1 Tax=Streptomyces sp. e14 TaxID=645465 RepID=UPI0001D05E44|nr:hypothetical protein [Streptomyces sp. e14]EFF88784.1 hypothetical protein SSTG_05791 [Streptomyces sp. e14]